MPSSELAGVLAPLLEEIRGKQMTKPTHAPGTKVAVKAVAQLGTQMAQVIDIEDEMGEAISIEDMKAAVHAAQAKEAERKAAREAKTRDPVAMKQSDEAPELVVGLNIQTYERLAADNTPFWAACKVVAVADGTDKYKTGRRKKKKGSLLIETAYADGSSEQEWKTLRAANFNCHRAGGWCVDLGDSSDEEVEVINAAADGYDSADSESSVSSSESDSEHDSV